MVSLLVAGWPSSVVALIAALALAAMAFAAWVAVAACSEGELARSGALAAARDPAAARFGAGARWRGAAVVLAALLGLLLADDGAGRLRAVALLLGGAAALLAEAWALRVAGMGVARLVEAEREAGAATTGSRRVAECAADGVEAVALLLAAGLAWSNDDPLLLLFAAAAALAVAALAARDETDDRLLAVAAAGGDGLARRLAWIALAAAAAAVGGAERGGGLLAWWAVARLFGIVAARCGIARPLLPELAAALLVPSFFAGTPGPALAAIGGWHGVELQLPLLIGLAALPAVAPLARWLANRPAGGPERAACWLVWSGALLALAHWLGGRVGVVWLAAGFGAAVEQQARPLSNALSAAARALARRIGRDEASPTLAAAPGTARAHAALAAFGELLLAMAAGGSLTALVTVRTGGDSGVDDVARSGALFGGAVAALLLRTLLAATGAPVAEGGGSTASPARAMIPPALWSALVVFELPRLAPALLGNALAGMVLIGFLAMPGGAPAEPGPRGASRSGLPRWLVVVIVLALASAATRDDRWFGGR